MAAVLQSTPEPTKWLESSHNALNPFLASHVQAVIEDIRLLEAYVTAPLGLYSDVRMLRESLPFPDAADLSREETQSRRAAYSALTDTPLEMTLATVSSLRKSLDILEMSKDGDSPPLSPGVIAQGRRVLDRVEQRVEGDIRAEVASRIRGLYVIVDPEATRDRPIVEVAEAVVKGGAAVVQLRDKTHDKGQVLPVAYLFKQLCERYDALFIVNDDEEGALSADADGLHVEQTDLPVTEARKTLALTQIVGRSISTVDEAVESQARGADYISVGPVFHTSTMGRGSRPAVGVEMISKAKGLVAQPVVAIGGINAENAAEVLRAGADCVAVVSAITLADDPEAAAGRMVEVIDRAE